MKYDHCVSNRRFDRAGRILFISTVLLFIVVFTGCGDDGKKTVWGIDATVFLERLRKNESDFLAGLDFSRLKTDEVFRLGDGAALFVGITAGELDLEAVERRLLTLEFEKGREPFRQEAGDRLAFLLVSGEMHEEAERVLSAMVKMYPSNGDYFFRLMESRYRQQKYAAVLKMFDSLKSSKSPPVTKAFSAEEILLWEAVASTRENSKGWEGLFRDLFYDFPASKVHVRAFEFLGIAQPRISRFPADEAAAFTGKARMAAQEYGNSAANFDIAIKPGSVAAGSTWMLREAARSWQGAGRSLEGAEKLRSLIPSLQGEVLFTVREMIGRLYRAASKYEPALKWFSDAYEIAPDDSSRDRVLWYILSTRMKSSPDTLYKFLPEVAEKWHDPEYFSDIFNDLCLSWTGSSKWNQMWNLYQVLGKTGPDSSVSQYAVILASLIRGGLLAVPGKDRNSVVKELYGKASAGGKLYYRMLAAAALGRNLELELKTDGEASMKNPGIAAGLFSAAGGSETGGERTDYDAHFAQGFLKLINGCFQYGLLREGYRLADKAVKVLLEKDVFDIAGKLDDAGYHVESLRLLSRLYMPEDVPYPREILEAMFPRAFAEYIAPLASKEKYLPAFLYGLIKEESYFNPSVVSGAGAVGLSQLLPSTAADIGARIGIRKPDLTDPETNLKIGSRYLGILLAKYGEPLYALSGYNAGYGRIGSWIGEWGGFPFEVFAEKLPYAETRMYIRKVVVATVFYACLYEGLSLSEAVSYFFPDIALR